MSVLFAGVTAATGDLELFRIAEPCVHFGCSPTTAALSEFALRREGAGSDLAIKSGSAEPSQIENFVQAHQAEGGLRYHVILLHLLAGFELAKKRMVSRTVSSIGPDLADCDDNFSIVSCSYLALSDVA